MPKCIHKAVCREYMKKFGYRLDKNCTPNCKCFEPVRDDVFEVSAKQIGDIISDALVDAQRYHSRRYC